MVSEGGALAGASIYGAFGSEKAGEREGYGSLREPIYIVRFAHGLWPAWELKRIVRRRWLYKFGLDLYSRPHDQLYPCARGNVYSRPCAYCRLTQTNFIVPGPRRTKNEQRTTKSILFLKGLYVKIYTFQSVFGILSKKSV